MGEATKRITVDVPEALHRRAKMEAVRDGKTLSEVMRALLIEWVEQREKRVRGKEANAGTAAGG